MKLFSFSSPFLIIISFAFILGCSDSETLPSSTGKSGEIVVVVEKNLWKDAVGNSLRNALSHQQIGLPQPEPLFDLINVPQNDFSRIFQTHRNILLVEISDTSKTAIRIKKNSWSNPQLIIKVTASSDTAMATLINQSATTLAEYFINEERERLVTGYKKLQAKGIIEKLEKNHQITMVIPQEGFAIAKDEKDFVWIRRETGEMSQGILIYTQPYANQNVFEKEQIIALRDSLTEKYIPGPTDSSYMTTDHNFSLTTQQVTVNGNYAVELRGLWKVQNDFMGGPFVSYTIYDKKNNRIITAEGYVFAPKFNKREYLRQLEAILNSVKGN